MRHGLSKAIDTLTTHPWCLVSWPYLVLTHKKLKVMNIFSALRVYAGKWSVKATRAFTSDEISAVEKATVVDSQYGQSVCFMMVGGGMTYIPLDQNSSKATGEEVDLTQASLVTLEKKGEADIYRVSC